MRTPRRMPPKARSIELSAPDSVRHKIVVVGGAPPLEEHQCKLCGSRTTAAVARYVNWTTGEHWHLVCGEGTRVAHSLRRHVVGTTKSAWRSRSPLSA
jgi:hypothetical protein